MHRSGFCVALSCALLIAACGGTNSPDGGSRNGGLQNGLPPADDLLETGLQGQVPMADQMSGRAALGYRKGLRLVGQNPILNRGANFSLAWIDVDSNFANLVSVDDYTTYFRVLFMSMAAVVCLASGRFVEHRLQHPGEYYGLIILSTIGAIGMAAAEELMTAYLSLELLSFSLYILTSYAKYDARSNEAGIKYMILGAFSSALLLYGISLIYGITGSTYYGEIAASLSAGTEDFDYALLAALVLIIAGLGFKVATVPFHMWTPDAYEGAPVAVTAYLSTTSKAAGFALLLRLFSSAFEVVHDDWSWMIAGVSAATMILGNLVALFLLLIPGVNIGAFFLVNGYLIGREYFEFAAMRFRPEADARDLRRRHAGTVFLAGLVIAGFLAVPLLNLLTPLFAGAMMVHLHKMLSAAEQGRTAADERR